MKNMPFAVFLGVLIGMSVFTVAARGQENDAGAMFIEENSWWNLYFAKENNPLQRRDSGSINAVKVLAVDERRPSWIKIAFPSDRQEHYSIFKPASKAHGKDQQSLQAALSKWETTVSQWEVMWVNLDFVVYMTKVGQATRENAE